MMGILKNVLKLRNSNIWYFEAIGCSEGQKAPNGPLQELDFLA